VLHAFRLDFSWWPYICIIYTYVTVGISRLFVGTRWPRDKKKKKRFKTGDVTSKFGRGSEVFDGSYTLTIHLVNPTIPRRAFVKFKLKHSCLETCRTCGRKYEFEPHFSHIKLIEQKKKPNGIVEQIDYRQSPRALKHRRRDTYVV